jgi:hypothetical protein
MQHAHIDISRGLDGEPVVLACFDLREDEVAAAARAVAATAAERYRTPRISADDVLELRELTALSDELEHGSRPPDAGQRRDPWSGSEPGAGADPDAVSTPGAVSTPSAPLNRGPPSSRARASADSCSGRRGCRCCGMPSPRSSSPVTRQSGSARRTGSRSRSSEACCSRSSSSAPRQCAQRSHLNRASAERSRREGIGPAAGVRRGAVRAAGLPAESPGASRRSLPRPAARPVS